MGLNKLFFSSFFFSFCHCLQNNSRLGTHLIYEHYTNTSQSHHVKALSLALHFFKAVGLSQARCLTHTCLTGFNLNKSTANYSTT